jgi:Spy/CpxP family protein refolding chaperone
MRMAIRSLGLSPEQRMQIKAMMRGFHRSRLAGSPVPRRQMIAQIERVLTPAQRERFEAQMARHGQTGGPNGPGGPQSTNGSGRPGQGYDDPQGPGPGGDQQGPGAGAPSV